MLNATTPAPSAGVLGERGGDLGGGDVGDGGDGGGGVGDGGGDGGGGLGDGGSAGGAQPDT